MTTTSTSSTARPAPARRATRDAVDPVALLAELGERVADDGPDTHHASLLAVSELAAVAAPVAAGVLADATAPPVVRARALAVATGALVRTAGREASASDVVTAA